MIRLALLVLAVCTAVLTAALPALSAPPHTAEVVVTLEGPSLARAIRTSRALTAAAKRRRLDLGSPTSRGYLADLARLQRRVEGRIESTIPGARVHRRYRIVLNALAVALPRDSVGGLATVPGVTSVQTGGHYGPALDQSPELIGADALWDLPSLSTAGNGIKIGIIDTGLDPRHPFFDASGYSYPPGFPKGNRAFTTPKVIVARAFAPPNVTWKYARLPYDPELSDHGEHVAGIAAGNYNVRAIGGRGSVSGVAPRAYLGNYKVLSAPSPAFSLIENSAEVVAAIEAAVRDGMDVINMSFGEYDEIGPARNIVDEAVDAAADAGVVPVSAAGNSYSELGRGSIGSPATAAKGIAVAAVTKSRALAPWSSRGPTPVSLRLKPEVSAPGVAILSAFPLREGTWGSLSGTSMAAPHVAGAAALLRQRHPDWTVAEIKSALVLTGRPVLSGQGTGEVVANGEGGGLVDLPRADEPLVFARPSALSFGLVRAGTAARRTIDLSDAGGGAGRWAVSVRLQTRPRGVTLSAPQSVDVPGALEVAAAATAEAAEVDVTGFLVLTQGGQSRRIPFWFRTERPRLGAPARVLTAAGLYRGDTRNGRARVTSYRYPDAPEGIGISNVLRGPEQVFRIRIPAGVANFGVRLVRHAAGVEVTPRIVLAGDENRLAGLAALPADLNPYRDSYGDRRPVVAVIRPSRGAYDIVFETRARALAGPFAFRLWAGDRTPPTLRLVTRSVKPVGTLIVSAADGGSGVDPRSIRATIDGDDAAAVYSGGRVKVFVGGVAQPGRHRLVLQVSDFQETKNSESTRGYLPNTRTLRAVFHVR